jgi:hypothetical protein
MPIFGAHISSGERTLYLGRTLERTLNRGGAHTIFGAHTRAHTISEGSAHYIWGAHCSIQTDSGSATLKRTLGAHTADLSIKLCARLLQERMRLHRARPLAASCAVSAGVWVCRCRAQILCAVRRLEWVADPQSVPVSPFAASGANAHLAWHPFAIRIFQRVLRLRVAIRCVVSVTRRCF